jgi:glutathione S-transferase
MSKIILYMFPGACSRVTMTALEEVGVDYQDQVVNIAAGAQNSPEYLAIHRRGKVPALSVDGAMLLENVAILSWLDARFPAARLLPRLADSLASFQGLSDLAWCSSTLHPEVRQVRAPFKWTTGDPAGVQSDGLKKFAKSCDYIAPRLQAGGWWYGSDWSIVDTYVYWTYSTAGISGFSLDRYPALLAHAERVRARPAFQRAHAREVAAVQRENLAVPLETL